MPRRRARLGIKGKGEWDLKKEWDSDRAWDFIRQTATVIALIHPGLAALVWAANERPELIQDIAMARDSIRDAVHDQDIIKVFKATEDWKRAYVVLFYIYPAASSCARPAPHATFGAGVETVLPASPAPLIDGELDKLS